MCAVSAVGDYWTPKINGTYPWVNPAPNVAPGPLLPWDYGKTSTFSPYPVSREEFNNLKNLVEQIHKELLAAKKQDEDDGNPDCAMDEKVEIFKRLAEIFKRLAEITGVSFDDVFKR